MKRRPCWCLKPILWELNSFLVQTLSFVSINLHRCWHVRENTLLHVSCFKGTRMTFIRQGHPMTVFCKISVRRSKYCLEFSVTWGRLKVCRWPLRSWISIYPFMVFEACLIWFPMIFSSLIFSFHFPSWEIFRRKKEAKHFQIQKSGWERNLKPFVSLL